MSPISLDFKADRGTVQRSAIHALLIQLLLKAKGLITLPILTYFLLPGELGAFNLVLVTATLLMPLFTLNLTDGPVIHLVREQSKERIAAMYYTVVNASFLCSIVCCALLLAAGAAAKGPHSRTLFLAAITILAMVLHKVASYLLAVFQQTGYLVRNTILRDGLSAVLSVSFAAAGWGAIGLVVALALGNIVAALTVGRMTLTALPYRPRIERKILVKFLRTSLPLLPVFFFSWVLQVSDSYFLAHFHGDGAVGKYAVVYSIAGVILCATFALNFFWFPVSAHLWQEDRERYKRLFRQIFMGFCAVLLPTIVLFELNAPLILRLLARKADYQSAAGILGLIAFAYALQVFITLLTAPLYANSNNGRIFGAYLLGGLANLTCNFLLIPQLGVLGAAISTVVAYLIVTVAMGIFVYTSGACPFIERRLFGLAAPTLLAWLGAASLRIVLPSPALGLATSLFCIAGFGILIWCLLSQTERSTVQSLLHSRRSP